MPAVRDELTVDALADVVWDVLGCPETIDEYVDNKQQPSIRCRRLSCIPADLICGRFSKPA